MAEKSPVTPLEGSNIEQFMVLVPLIMSDVAAYAGSGVEDPAASAGIRQLKVMTAALMAALQTIR